MAAESPAEPPPIGDSTSDPPAAPPHPESDAVLARRAQLLATEHWGLLAARSTAQSEVLTRIALFLTLVSAGLVTIGLLGQATGFEDWFATAALAILGFLAVVGWLTGIRVMNVADEDLMYVIAMNRLRAAYVDLDPPIEKYLMAGVTDDISGMVRTYSFIRRRTDLSQVAGSSMVLIALVHGCVVGLFAGGLLTAVGVSVGGAVAVGVVVFVVVLTAWIVAGYRTYRETWRTHRPLRQEGESV